MALLKVKQIKAAAKISNYLLLRNFMGGVCGVNSKMVLMGKNNSEDPEKDTQFTSFKIVSINEYITHKVVLISKDS